jgi:hypothetical protein
VNRLQRIRGPPRRPLTKSGTKMKSNRGRGRQSTVRGLTRHESNQKWRMFRTTPPRVIRIFDVIYLRADEQTSRRADEHMVRRADEQTHAWARRSEREPKKRIRSGPPPSCRLEGLLLAYEPPSCRLEGVLLAYEPPSCRLEGVLLAYEPPSCRLEGVLLAYEPQRERAGLYDARGNLLSILPQPLVCLFVCLFACLFACLLVAQAWNARVLSVSTHHGYIDVANVDVTASKSSIVPESWRLEVGGWRLDAPPHW